MNCPACHTPGAYQGLSTVECLSKDCRFYSARWEQDQAAASTVIPINDPALVEPLACSTCGSTSGMCFCLQAGGCRNTQTTSNSSPAPFTFTVAGKTITCSNGERVYYNKQVKCYWVLRSEYDGDLYDTHGYHGPCASTISQMDYHVVNTPTTYERLA